MNNNRTLSVISDLKKVKREVSSLRAREKELSKPLMKDLTKLPIIYKIVLEHSNGVKDGWFMKKMMLISLAVYSPSALAGGKITDGLRRVLGNILGYKAHSAMSNAYKQAILWYEIYPDKRAEFDEVYSKVVDRLSELGLIK